MWGGCGVADAAEGALDVGHGAHRRQQGCHEFWALDDLIHSVQPLLNGPNIKQRPAEPLAQQPASSCESPSDSAHSCQKAGEDGGDTAFLL